MAGNGNELGIKIGYSTCPNDTFIFDAMVHGKVDTEGLKFSTFLGDVEELNKKAFKKELDITKLSYHAYAYLSNEYLILDSGSALGDHNGPLLLSKEKIEPEEVENLKIAIPGKYTTANLLLRIAFPNAVSTKEYLFSDIEKAILCGETDVGLAIHENRFTYAEKGLKKILDLGDYWQNLSGKPIPLGGIVVRRDLGVDDILKINRVLRRSIEFAFNYTDEVLPYVKKYAQEMEEEVMLKHINLYVNNYSLDLGKEGKSAIRKLYEFAEEKKLIPEVNKNLFISDL